MLVVVLALANCAIGQQAMRPDLHQILATKVPSYSIKATNLLEAAARIASDFNLPIAVEWVGAPGAEKPITYQWQNTTVEQIVYDLATFDVDYQVDASSGVIHLWNPATASSQRNPLNIRIPEFSVTDTYAGVARFVLQDQINGIMFPRPEEKQSARAGSYGAGAGDRLVTLAMKDTTGREILDALLVKSRFAMWLVVFPEQQQATGYLVTKPPWRQTMRQPDVDFLTRYYDPASGQSRVDWEAGLGK
jgi:hypothetical protein